MGLAWPCGYELDCAVFVMASDASNDPSTNRPPMPVAWRDAVAHNDAERVRQLLQSGELTVLEKNKIYETEA